MIAPSHGRRGILPALALVAALLVAGCAESGPAPQALVTGSTADTPSRVAAAIYAGALRGAGAQVSAEHPVGTDAELLGKLDDRSLDLIPAWSGELLGQLDPGTAALSADDVYAQLNKALPQGVSAGDVTSVANKPLVFVAESLATSAGVDELAECARLPVGIPLVTIDEPTPDIVAALSAAGCGFAPPRQLDAQTAVAEVAAGRAVGLFPPLSVAADDSGLQGLADTGDVLRAEDLVPVFRTASLSRGLFQTMNKVAGELTTADLTTMSREVDGGAEISTVAQRWLGEHSL
ncbi:glycine betaine ABC transporter substrate-binding protein [Williamsia soli]|uniref:glycine betaine ABC transporter substrate-binding protein n=1 Tax=Williamsia soli TaxID=364929 RepID=UPI001A9E1528|nr:glycine betaine ABC transporter substrate-binding protein [Williamsia soli]